MAPPLEQSPPHAVSIDHAVGIQTLSATELAEARVAPQLDTPGAIGARATGAARRLVVVSNRVSRLEKGQSSAGGLAVGIHAALQQGGGIWFGWSGQVKEKAGSTPELVSDGPITYATLDLSRQDFNEYYTGYANQVLWPLFHYRASLVSFSRAFLAGYLRVNRRFAQSLSPLLIPQDSVWVHDYHLIPLAEELRALDHRQPIGFFLHTPFPAAELLRVLPNHAEIARMLCAYDLVGFQTESDLQGFRDYLVRWAGGEDLEDGSVRAFGRVVRLGAFPIGIDTAAVEDLARAAERSRPNKRLTDSLRDRALMIGVDRLDYSKGLSARFHAYARLIETQPRTRGRIVFMQIAPPSRSDVPHYREIRQELETAAGCINGRHAEFDWTPVRYLNKSFNHRILMGFYRSSRIGLVTPLRDGMNLVAKEYVASQNPEDPGVLVLSCFAGAACELPEAILVNPHDTDGMADAILQGLDMSLGERKERWTAMMNTLRRNDITAWRRGFVEALGQVGSPA